MKNVFKKAFASVLAAALCLSLAGCYSENNTWAAKKGDETFPIGGYIYYLNSAYSEAMSKVSSGEEVLKATIEGQDSQTWIRERAKEFLNSYYFISAKFDELGLELTDEDIADIDANTDAMWSYYKTSMEEMGIAKDSYKTALAVYNTKYQQVMRAVYGEGGEMEVTSDEMKTYFVDNYYSYEYFYADLSKKDEEGNSVDMTDEEKSDLKAKLEGYVKKINAGSMSVEDAATEYAGEIEDSSTYLAPSPTLADNLGSVLKDAVSGAKDNTAVLAESTTAYYVVRRLPIADKFEEMTEDDSQKFTLLANMKSDDFVEYVKEQAKNVEGVEFNEKAMNRVNLTRFVTESNKNGTSSASSEADGADSSEPAESSSASSETESSASESE